MTTKGRAIHLIPRHSRSEPRESSSAGTSRTLSLNLEAYSLSGHRPAQGEFLLIEYLLRSGVGEPRQHHQKPGIGSQWPGIWAEAGMEIWKIVSKKAVPRLAPRGRNGAVGKFGLLSKALLFLQTQGGGILRRYIRRDLFDTKLSSPEAHLEYLQIDDYCQICSQEMLSSPYPFLQWPVYTNTLCSLCEKE